MSDRLLDQFLEKGLLDLKGNDAWYEHITLAAESLSTYLQANPKEIIPFTYAALLPDVGDQNPAIKKTLDFLKAEWKTYASVSMALPKAMLRVIVLDALLINAELDDAMKSAPALLLASALPHLSVGKEKEVWKTALDDLLRAVERQAEAAWSVPSRINISAFPKINVPPSRFSVKGGGVDKKVLEKGMRAAAGPHDEQGQATGGNQHWPHQGDPWSYEFAPLAASAISKAFVALAEEERFSPARGIIEQMMHWHEDLDGIFVKQFQTTGFDARLWELYLFAAFAEMEYRIEHIHAVPDLTCVGVLGELTVEAMTVNPSRDQDGSIRPQPPRDSPEQQRAFLHEYMPIRFAKTLTSKLDKEYWEKPSAKDKPLLFAIQDFSAEASMVSTRSALEVYLYGYDHEWEHDSNGQLTITARPVGEHRWGKKAIQSGFFDLPGAEHVSAVLSNNSGTISKFNRMGVLAGFGSPRVVLVRQGFAMDHDPNAVVPQEFRYRVHASGHQETWTEGLDVFHNPRAIYPIDPAMLPEAAHHRRLRDGRVESLIPPFHPLGSHTIIFLSEDEVAPWP